MRHQFLNNFSPFSLVKYCEAHWAFNLLKPHIEYDDMNDHSQINEIAENGPFWEHNTIFNDKGKKRWYVIETHCYWISEKDLKAIIGMNTIPCEKGKDILSGNSVRIRNLQRKAQS